MPRVEERLLASFGLLAERYGTVRRDGFLIPLELTHQALGEIVGARRPTVSLALKNLNADGRLVRCSDGWVLAHAVAEKLSQPEPPVDDGLSDDRLVNHVRVAIPARPRRSIA